MRRSCLTPGMQQIVTLQHANKLLSPSVSATSSRCPDTIAYLDALLSALKCTFALMRTVINVLMHIGEILSSLS